MTLFSKECRAWECDCDRKLQLPDDPAVIASERAHKEIQKALLADPARVVHAAAKVKESLAKAAAGAHYKKGKFEVWEVIEELQKTWPPEVRYHVGSALKYLGRLGAKEGASVTDDIEKAITFLTRALAVLKGIETK